jgi:cytochrome b561
VADLAPRGSALKRALRDWHAQVGLVVLALVWFRLAWRLGNPMPSIVPPPAAWQRLGAHAVEWTFYALMIVQPVLGIVMMQADGKAVSLLGLTLPTFVGLDKHWAHQIEDVHGWLGNAMMVLIGVHVVATLFHWKALRDNTLARMLGRAS